MIHIFILILLILLNAFFALAEIAIVTVNDKKVKKLASQGNKAAAQVFSLLQNSNDFLATIQVGITLSGFLTSASASQSFSDPLTNFLLGLSLPIPKSMLTTISTFSITFILSYFSLVFGELVPKKIAMQDPEKVSYKIAGILLVFSKIFRPFIRFLSLSSDLVVRCFGIDPNKNEETVTEEEILMMVDAGQEKGLIEDKAKSMITKVFDFDNTPVSEVMTHRVDIIAIRADMPINQVIDIVMREGRSRVPVYIDDLDHIIGMLYVKDLLKFINDDVPKNFKLTDLTRQPIFVPSTKRCDELFAEFTSSKKHIALVIDEYGGVEGIVTMEDILEEIVGDIFDETDEDEPEYIDNGNGVYIVDGTMNIEDFFELIEYKGEFETDYETVAGFCQEVLNRFAHIGDEFIFDDRYHIEILAADETVVEKIKVVDTEFGKEIEE